MPVIEVWVFQTLEERDADDRSRSYKLGIASTCGQLLRRVSDVEGPKGYYHNDKKLSSMDEALEVLGGRIHPTRGYPLGPDGEPVFADDPN